MLKIEGKKFDWVNIPLMQCVEGNALDTHFTVKVYGKLLEEVRKKRLEKLYEKLISPLTVAFRDIEYDGLLIDQDKLQELKTELNRKIIEVEAELKNSDRIPLDTNLGSNQQLCKILFSLYKEGDEWMIDENVGFGLYPVEWTKKGQPSTNAETLAKVKAMVEKEYLDRGLNAEK